LQRQGRREHTHPWALRKNGEGSWVGSQRGWFMANQSIVSPVRPWQGEWFNRLAIWHCLNRDEVLCSCEWRRKGQAWSYRRTVVASFWNSGAWLGCWIGFVLYWWWSRDFMLWANTRFLHFFDSNNQQNWAMCNHGSNSIVKYTVMGANNPSTNIVVVFFFPFFCLWPSCLAMKANSAWSYAYVFGLQKPTEQLTSAMILLALTMTYIYIYYLLTNNVIPLSLNIWFFASQEITLINFI
jgi:hypothetical protein